MSPEQLTIWILLMSLMWASLKAWKSLISAFFLSRIWFQKDFSQIRDDKYNSLPILTMTPVRSVLLVMEFEQLFLILLNSLPCLMIVFFSASLKRVEALILSPNFQLRHIALICPNSSSLEVRYSSGNLVRIKSSQALKILS